MERKMKFRVIYPVLKFAESTQCIIPKCSVKLFSRLAVPRVTLYDRQVQGETVVQVCQINFAEKLQVVESFKVQYIQHIYLLNNLGVFE